MQEQKLQSRKRKAHREGNNELLASTCIDLAELYCSDGSYHEAIKEYSVVANVYKKIGKELDYARANRMIGEAYTHLREYEQALAFQQTYLRVAIQQDDKLEQQRALATIGHTHLTIYLDNVEVPDKNQLNLAYKSFMKSLVLCERLTGISKQEHKDMMARLLANLGLVEESRENYDKGVELVQKSISICKSHDLFEQLERDYRILASLYSRKEEFDKAISQYNLAIETAGRLKDKKSLMCISLISKADILIRLSDFQAAKGVLLKAHKIRHPSVDDRESIERHLKVVAAMCYAEESLLTVCDSDYTRKKQLYEKLGDGASRLKNYSTAVEYYEKMLSAAENNGETGVELRSCYVSLAETYGDTKQFDLAIKYLKKEYDISKPNTRDSIMTLLNIADSMEGAGESLVEIEHVYRKARDECLAAGEKHLEHKTLLRHIAILRQSGKVVQAEELQEELGKNNFILYEADSEPSQEMALDIGDDISISNITDVSDESDVENDVNLPRSSRKRNKRFVMKRNNKGETDLHLACISGNITLARRLIEQGHIINVRENCGWLPIHEACNFGHIEIVALLIEKGAAINDRGGVKCDGMTPLHDAAVNGHLEIMQLLLDKGASATSKTDLGETPFHILKKWRLLPRNEKLDLASESLYENLMERLGQDMEKLGHTTDSFVTTITNSSLILEDEEQNRPFHQTKQRNTNVSPEMGCLRRNSSFDEDLDGGTSKESDSESSKSIFSVDGETNVRDEYKRLMESLKHPLREANIERKRKSGESNDRRPAYLEANEIGDDWLEVDLIENHQKKRKTDPFINKLGRTKTRDRSISRASSNSSLKSRNFSDEIPNDNRDFVSNELPMPTPVNMIDSDEEFKSSNNVALKKKRKSQMSLMDSGFTRNRSFSPTQFTSSGLVCNKRKQQTKLTNFGHTYTCFDKDSPGRSKETVLTHINDNFEHHNLSNIFNSEPMLSVDVRIDGKLYRVPVPASEAPVRTIKWLADEATKRYNKKECMKPSLELETKNGAILADDDVLTILFSAGSTQAEEVEARIVKWNLPPLIERYQEACVHLKTVPNENIAKVLQETTTSLNISEMFLDTENIAPVFKAINRQINLHHLDLSGNIIDDESFQLLCMSLPSLNNLAVFNLSSSQLTANNVGSLADIFTQSTKSILENLVSLDLSYNPLGDESFKYLAIISRYLKFQTLKLRSVDFTSDIFNLISNGNISLSLDYIVNFDISYNQLMNPQIALFLSWLKPQNIVELNISSNISQEGLVKDVVKWFETGGEENLRMNTLNLSRCCATDAEIFELLRILLLAKNFQKLDLSYNNNLTSLSLRRLIQQHPSFNELNLIGCENILRYFDDCTESTWNCLQLKQLKIDYNNNKERDTLANIWKKKFKENATIVELRGFLDLSISE